VLLRISLSATCQHLEHGNASPHWKNLAVVVRGMSSTQRAPMTVLPPRCCRVRFRSCCSVSFLWRAVFDCPQVQADHSESSPATRRTPLLA